MERANLGNLAQKRMRMLAHKRLGNKCDRCGTTGSSSNWLELHHRFPEHSKNGYERAKQALANPQKFELLCRRCHLKLHVYRLMRSKTIDPDDFMDLKAAWLASRRAG